MIITNPWVSAEDLSSVFTLSLRYICKTGLNCGIWNGPNVPSGEEHSAKEQRFSPLQQPECVAFGTTFPHTFCCCARQCCEPRERLLGWAQLLAPTAAVQRGQRRHQLFTHHPGDAHLTFGDDLELIILPLTAHSLVWCMRSAQVWFCWVGGTGWSFSCSN